MLVTLLVDADRNVVGHGTGGLILGVPAKTLPALVERTLPEALLGTEGLHGSGNDGDPLLVLTEFDGRAE
ncbi:hypothetical protein ACVV2G_10530 [Streptomyces ziwulingensis]